jgi:hypothetical protein
MSAPTCSTPLRHGSTGCHLSRHRDGGRPRRVGCRCRLKSDGRRAPPVVTSRSGIGRWVVTWRSDVSDSVHRGRLGRRRLGAGSDLASAYNVAIGLDGRDPIDPVGSMAGRMPYQFGLSSRHGTGSRTSPLWPVDAGARTCHRPVRELVPTIRDKLTCWDAVSSADRAQAECNPPRELNLLGSGQWMEEAAVHVPVQPFARNDASSGGRRSSTTGRSRAGHRRPKRQ